jgi:hypothetical protein
MPPGVWEITGEPPSPLPTEPLPAPKLGVGLPPKVKAGEEGEDGTGTKLAIVLAFAGNTKKHEPKSNDAATPLAHGKRRVWM